MRRDLKHIKFKIKHININNTLSLSILSSIHNLDFTSRKCKIRDSYQEASRKGRKKDIHYMMMQITPVLSLPT